MKRLHLGWCVAFGVVMASGLSAACSSDDPEPSNGGTGGASTGGRTMGDGGANTGGKSTGGTNTGGTSTGGTGTGGDTEGGVPACKGWAGDEYPWFWLQPDGETDGETDGGADAGDAGGAAPPPSGNTVEVEGTLTDVERTSEPCKAVSPEPPNCPPAAAVPDGFAVRIATGDGGTRTFILAARTVHAFNEALRSTVGKEVLLRVKSASGLQLGPSRSFVLSDPTGTVIAYDAGPAMASLIAADHPDIGISVGGDVCSRSNACGDFIVQEMLFRGDTEVAGTPGGAEFNLNDWRYIARTRGVTRTVKSTCADQEDAPQWLVWRKARLSVDGGAE